MAYTALSTYGACHGSGCKHSTLVSVGDGQFEVGAGGFIAHAAGGEPRAMAPMRDLEYVMGGMHDPDDGRKAMNVSEAVKSRRSVRAFLPTEVPLDGVRRALQSAARAPSGGNLQPWRLHVLSGPALARFRALMQVRLARGDLDPSEYPVYPANLHEPYRSQRFAVGEALYETLGIERANKLGRLQQFARNYDFFGAPLALFCFVDRRMGHAQWSDLGMYLQTAMLLLREQGIDSCAQEAWSAYNQTVSEFVGAAPELMLFCGMSIGYADPSAPVNTLISERAPLDAFAVFHEQ